MSDNKKKNIKNKNKREGGLFLSYRWWLRRHTSFINVLCSDKVKFKRVDCFWRVVFLKKKYLLNEVENYFQRREKKKTWIINPARLLLSNFFFLWISFPQQRHYIVNYTAIFFYLTVAFFSASLSSLSRCIQWRSLFLFLYKLFPWCFLFAFLTIIIA